MLARFLFLGSFIGSIGPNKQYLLTICFLFSTLWCFFWCSDTELGNFVTFLQSKTYESFRCFSTLSCSSSRQPNLLWGHYVARGSKLTADIWVVMAVSNSVYELILEMYRLNIVSLWEKLQDMPVTSALTSEDGECTIKKVPQKVVGHSFPLRWRCLGIDTLTHCILGITLSNVLFCCWSEEWRY